MEEKDLMEGVLLLEKGVCDLYLHVWKTYSCTLECFVKCLIEIF